MNARLPTLLLSPLPDPPRVGLDDLVGFVCSPTRMHPLIPVNLRPPPLLFEVIDVAALFKAVGRLCGAADNVGELARAPLSVNRTSSRAWGLRTFFGHRPSSKPSRPGCNTPLALS